MLTQLFILECTDPDGKCRPVGYTYKEHCVEYECQVSQFMGIMQADFIPINIGKIHIIMHAVELAFGYQLLSFMFYKSCYVI